MNDTQVNPRETFRDFSPLVQYPLTFISGRPLSGQAPLFQMTPVLSICYDLLKYVAGVSGGIFVVSLSGFYLLLLPVFWILTVNGARSLTSDAHYAGHSAVTGKKRFDRFLGDLLSLIVVSPNMDDYAHGHNKDHHGKSGIGTLDDPDIGLMQLMGFVTGRSYRYYVARWFLAMISPRFHLKYTVLRLRSTFYTAPIWRMVAAWVILCALIILSWSTPAGKFIFFAWIIPIFPLYAISACLQFPSEHMWLNPQQNGETRRDYLLRVSHGRFFLIPAPTRNTLGSWAKWTLRMVPMCLARSFVCVSILPAHDYHHRFANRRDWPMEPYLRQAEVDNGAYYEEYWGIWKPTSNLFHSWSMLASSASPNVNTMFSLIEKLLRRNVPANV